MEYRKRTKRRRTSRKHQQNYLGTLFCVVALFGAIVYLIGVSSVGSWVARNVVAPTFRTLGISDFQMNQNAADALNAEATSALVTETLRFPEDVHFALQMGVYTSLENAGKQAAALQSLGAAGYIYHADGKYRVFASSYPDETSLSAVRSQLAAEGLESASYRFERAATEWIVTASKKQIETVQNAMQLLLDLNDALYSLVYVFDEQKQEISAGKAALAALQSDLKLHETALKSIVGDSNDVSEQLSSCYESLLLLFDEALAYDGESAVVFSAKLKYLLLASEALICNFVETVETE